MHRDAQWIAEQFKKATKITVKFDSCSDQFSACSNE